VATRGMAGRIVFEGNFDGEAIGGKWEDEDSLSK